MAESLGEEHLPAWWNALWKLLGRKLLCIASLTWAAAERLKRDKVDAPRAKVIVRLNYIYLGAAIIATLVTLAVNWNALSGEYSFLMQIVRGVWFYFLLSRCTEVFAAFYRDAFDKMATGPRGSSALAPFQRVRLALNSYAELILNFALIYWLLPQSVWKCSDAPTSFTDILFYSASTITTSGGGGFIPANMSLQLLTIFEIACGLILLVVCFAVYAAGAAAASTAAQDPVKSIDSATARDVGDNVPGVRPGT